MATSKETIAHLLEQLEPLDVRARAMFGEYGVYCDDRIVALVCDDTFFLKPSPASASLGIHLVPAPPYPGAKDYFVIGDAIVADDEAIPRGRAGDGGRASRPQAEARRQGQARVGASPGRTPRTQRSGRRTVVGGGIMRAARVSSAGSLANIVVEDVPVPTLDGDQILVEVAAAALNPIDYKVALSGDRGGRVFPLTLGFDAVGTVSAVGSAVSSVTVGDRVCLMTDISAPGPAAEFVAVREHNVAIVPPGVDDRQAAGLPLAGLTVVQAFDLAMVSAGQSVLIHAGAGGVGHLAVQIAKSRGATVYATASARHLDLLAELGADHPIDYHATPPGKFADKVDVVLDTLGGSIAEATVAAMRPGSVHVSIVGFQGVEGGRTDVEVRRMLVEPRSRELAALVASVASGDLRVVTEEPAPLGEIGVAVAALHEGHTTGKRIIAVR